MLGVLFLARKYLIRFLPDNFNYYNLEFKFANSNLGGDADAEDISYCFDPLASYFEEIPLRNEAAFRDVRGVPANS